MKKQGRQIDWKKDTGYYKGRRLFEITEVDEGAFNIYVRLTDRESFDIPTWYHSIKSAKRGAGWFLRRLQEVVKLDKKEPKTCDDCWLQRDFGNYIPAGYCADKCAKIYNALKD